MKKEKKEGSGNILNFLSFFALVIVALLIIINNLLPVVKVELDGLMDFLYTVKDVFLLIVIGLSGYCFVSGKSVTWKVIYWVAMALFVAGIILYWFN